MINRYQIIRIHMLLAAFLLPIAIMYFISGALYTLDIKGHIDKQEIILQLKQPFAPNLDFLTQVTKKSLLERKVPLPTGEPTLKKRHGTYELRWGDLEHVVKLQPTHDTMTAKLTIKERSFLTQIMRIHRAQAGSVFKVFAIILVIGLIIMFATGIYMAQAVPKLRQPAILAIAIGLLTFLGLILA